MEILSMGTYTSPVWLVLAIGSGILAFIMLFICLDSCDVGEGVTCAIITVFLFFAWVFSIKQVYDSTQYHTYKVKLTDMTYEELQAKYEVINQEGNIITIVDFGGNKHE